jgi:site-specific recombinase XerD
MTHSAPLAIVAPAPLAAELPELAADVRAYADAAVAMATRRAYASDLRAFSTWCAERGLQSLPAAPETVALYLAALAKVSKMATIDRALVAISQAHKAAGLDSPRSSLLVRTERRGIARTLGTASTPKAALAPADLRAMVGTLPAGLAGLRDRALLVLGFAGAFRRSEIVGLDVADLAFGADGLTVRIRRSKTDQEGQGREVGIPYAGDPAVCSVRAVRAWLDAAGFVAGPLFRAVDRAGRLSEERLCDRSVALVVKRTALAAGLDAARFAGHSLRSGFATAAAKVGKSERAIMEQTGHRSVATVRRYIRRGSLFLDNAAAGLL